MGKTIDSIAMFAALALWYAVSFADDSTLRTALSSGPYRFLEYERCSSEHCWSECYLQWLNRDSYPPELTSTTQIVEISTGWTVESAEWRFDNGEHYLEVFVRAVSYGIQDQQKLVIAPAAIGQYVARIE